MIITKIEQYKKGRYKIFIDDQYEFVLYSGELRRYKLNENEAITSDTYKIITEEVLVKRVRLRAMNLLMKHSFTEKNLRTKLEESEYSAALVDNAIEYVSSFGYLNDRAFARDYIISHRDDKSIERIKFVLRNKGVSKDIICETLEEVIQDDGPIDEIPLIKKLLRKRKFDYENATYDEKRKIYGFLLNKGFSGETIRRVINCDYLT